MFSGHLKAFSKSYDSIELSVHVMSINQEFLRLLPKETPLILELSEDKCSDNTSNKCLRKGDRLIAVVSNRKPVTHWHKEKVFVTIKQYIDINKQIIDIKTKSQVLLDESNRKMRRARVVNTVGVIASDVAISVPLSFTHLSGLKQTAIALGGSALTGSSLELIQPSNENFSSTPLKRVYWGAVSSTGITDIAHLVLPKEKFNNRKDKVFFVELPIEIYKQIFHL
jgi:hypothetical protein